MTVMLACLMLVPFLAAVMYRRLRYGVVVAVMPEGIYVSPDIDARSLISWRDFKSVDVCGHNATIHVSHGRDVGIVEVFASATQVKAFVDLATRRAAEAREESS